VEALPPPDPGVLLVLEVEPEPAPAPLPVPPLDPAPLPPPTPTAEPLLPTLIVVTAELALLTSPLVAEPPLVLPLALAAPVVPLWSLVLVTVSELVFVSVTLLLLFMLTVLVEPGPVSPMLLSASTPPEAARLRTVANAKAVPACCSCLYRIRFSSFLKALLNFGVLIFHST
jgi:hypothetical protein